MTSPPEAARRAVSALFFVDGAALGGWAAHIADAKRSLHLTDQTLGLVLLASALGAVTTMPFAGSLIQRFGSNRVSVAFGFGLCAAVPLLFLCPSVVPFFIVLYLVGATNGQMDVAMNAHSMVIQDRYPRPILSAVHGWFSLGGFAGGAGAAIASRIGVTPLGHLLGASLILCLVLVLAQPHLLGAHVDQTGEGARLALPKGRLWLLGGLVLFAFISEGALWDWSGVFLRDVRTADPWLGALGFGLASLAMAAARFLGDGWTHRLGRQRLLALSSLAAGGGLLLAVNLPNVYASILGFALAGLGLANIVPLIFRAAAQVPGVSAGFGLAAVTTCGYSGFLGGPPVVGLIANERSLSFALGSVAILCLVIALSAKRAIYENVPEIAE